MKTSQYVKAIFGVDIHLNDTAQHRIIFVRNFAERMAFVWILKYFDGIFLKHFRDNLSLAVYNSVWRENFITKFEMWIGRHHSHTRVFELFNEFVFTKHRMVAFLSERYDWPVGVGFRWQTRKLSGEFKQELIHQVNQPGIVESLVLRYFQLIFEPTVYQNRKYIFNVPDFVQFSEVEKAVAHCCAGVFQSFQNSRCYADLRRLNSVFDG